MIRFGWGLHALAECDSTIVVVDVLCFTTCVSIAASRGATVIPCEWRDDRAVELGRAMNAVVAAKRGEPGYTLSPVSFLDAPAGLRIVLPSPNGSTIARIASQRGLRVLAGSLRNASAVARAIGAQPVTIVAAGEKWSDGTMRFALEDLLGAGAIIAALDGTKTAEAEAAAAAFVTLRPKLLDALRECASGRELIGWGYPDDVRLAAEVDADDVAPDLTAAANPETPASPPRC